MCVTVHRPGGGRRQSRAVVYRQQRSANCDVDTARPALRPDTAHGTSGSPRRYLEATRLRRLGASPGNLSPVVSRRPQP